MQILAIKTKDFKTATDLENQITLYNINALSKQMLELRRETYGKNDYYDYVWDRINKYNLFYFNK